MLDPQVLTRMHLEITDSSDPERPKSIPIQDDTINSLDFADQFGLTIYDNGYLNTSVCRYSIYYIDGEKGILRYRFVNTLSNMII